MPFTHKSMEPGGGIRFHDADAGTSLLLAGPSAEEFATRLPDLPSPAQLAEGNGGGGPTADQGLSTQPGPPRQASDAGGASGGGGAPPAPPVPPPVSAPPVDAPVSGMSAGPQMSMAPPVENQGPSTPGDFENRTGAPTALSNPHAAQAGPTGSSLKDLAIKAEMQAAADAARGTPGSYVKGGEFQVARTQQRPGAVAPKLVGDLLAAQKDQEKWDSDAAQWDARAAQEAEKIRADQAKAGVEQQARIKVATDKFEQQSTQAESMLSKATDDLANAKVDHNRWYNSRTTGEKVALTIGSLLGVFGASLSKGPDYAAQAIDKAIQGDIDQQKDDRETKKQAVDTAKGFFQHAKDRLGSTEAAAHLTYLANLKVAEAKILELDAAGRSKMSEGEPVPDIVGPDGQIIKGVPATYSIEAGKLLAHLRTMEAEKRLQLAQSLAGQESVQFQTRQGGMVGGKKPDHAKEAEHLTNAAKLGGPDKDQKNVVVGGQVYAVPHGISSTTVDDTQKRLNYADMAENSINAIKKRAEEAGGKIPNDPQTRFEIMQLAGPMAQVSGSGVPSESDKRDVADAVSYGPRQAAALERIAAKIAQGRAQAVQSLALDPSKGGTAPEKRYEYSPTPIKPLAAQPKAPGPLAAPAPAKKPLSAGYFESWEQNLSPEVRAALKPAPVPEKKR